MRTTASIIRMFLGAALFFVFMGIVSVPADLAGVFDEDAVKHKLEALVEVETSLVLINEKDVALNNQEPTVYYNGKPLPKISDKYGFKKVQEREPFEPRKLVEPTLYAVEGTVSNAGMDVVLDNSLSNVYYVDISQSLSSELQVEKNGEWEVMERLPPPDGGNWANTLTQTIIRPYVMYTYAVDFELLYGKLLPGNYKYIRNFELHSNGGGKKSSLIKKMSLSFEFTV